MLQHSFNDIPLEFFRPINYFVSIFSVPVLQHHENESLHRSLKYLGFNLLSDVSMQTQKSLLNI